MEQLWSELFSCHNRLAVVEGVQRVEGGYLPSGIVLPGNHVPCLAQAQLFFSNPQKCVIMI